MNREHSEDQLLEKIRKLPPEKLAAVEYFIDFLSQYEEDRLLEQATTKASETAFAAIWDNPDDAEYDRL
jgi:hypothetical protein